MEYIISSLVAIFIATLIVYKVANNLFGLGLRIKPLLLCAVCAMFISLVLPKIVVGFAGLPGTLAVLAIFSVVFAYFVARCDNEPSPQQKIDSEAESACCQAEPLIQPETTAKMTTQEEPNQDDSQVIAPVSESGDFNKLDATGLIPEKIDLAEELMVEQQLMDNHENEEDVRLAIGNPAEITVPESEFRQSSQLEDSSAEEELADEMKNLEEFTQNAVEVSSQISDVTVSEDVVVPAVSALLPEQPSVQEAESDSQVVAPIMESDSDSDETVTTGLIPENIELSEDLIVEQQLMESHENGEDAPLVIGNTIEITVPEVEFEQSIQLEDSSAEEELAAEIKGLAGEDVSVPVDDALQPSVHEADDSIMESNEPIDIIQSESEKLDDLIDFAFLNKESQNYEIAFNAFNKALTLYPNSEAAPFLVVEIGNILKNKGDYDGAIKVFGDGRNLSQTKQDEMMEQEFICTIAYLRIIKNVLLQNRLENIPFLKIPPHIVKQIDEEFREWRSIGNI